MNPSDPAGPSSLTGRLTLQTPLGAVLSESRIRLLEAIDRCGSLNRAAREVPLSYKAAWEALDTMNRLAPEPLVERLTGGRGGLVDVRLQLGDPETGLSGTRGTRGPTLLATITPESAELLGLAPGREVWALVKAPAVRLATPPGRCSTAIRWCC